MKEYADKNKRIGLCDALAETRKRHEQEQRRIDKLPHGDVRTMRQRELDRRISGLIAAEIAATEAR